jgi:hypothetical protein
MAFLLKQQQFESESPIFSPNVKKNEFSKIIALVPGIYALG